MEGLDLQDRQDAPVWQALEAGNTKQALKLVDKRIAKKKTEHLEVLRLHIRSRSSLPADQKAVLAAISEAAGAKRALKTLEDLNLQDESFENVASTGTASWKSVMGELRWNSVKVSPKTESMAVACFRACLNHGDWEHAQQIATSLDKNFAKERKYVFWNIVTLFARSGTDKTSIWGKLAHGQLDKLAEATKQAQDHKSVPARALQTSQELLLLLRITAVHGTPGDALAHLDNCMLAPESDLAKGDWELWRKKLQLMRDGQMWRGLYDLTARLLPRARTLNEKGSIDDPRMADWLVWSSYLESAEEVGLKRWTEVVSVEIAAHLDPSVAMDKAWRRNAALAWLRVTFAGPVDASAQVAASSKQATDLDRAPIRVVALVQYLQKWGDTSTAYRDVKAYVQQLDYEERTMLLRVLGMDWKNGKPVEMHDLAVASKMRNTHDIAQLITGYKVAYLINVSLLEHDRASLPDTATADHSDTTTALITLAYKSISAYSAACGPSGPDINNLLITDRHPADELAILGAICLIRLACMTTPSRQLRAFDCPEISYTLQAIVLLEYAWTLSTSNYQISLLLIRLYSRIGAGSLAKRAYDRLNIKQIQIDTMSHHLFERISTLHPHAFLRLSENPLELRAPMDYLERQQKLYVKTDKHVAHNIWTSFERGSYNSIFEFIEFSDVVASSLSRANAMIEAARLQRMNSMADVENATPAPLPDFRQHYSDTNDHETFPNLEAADTPTFERLTRYAPAASTAGLRLKLMSEHTVALIRIAARADADFTAHLRTYRETMHIGFKEMLIEMSTRNDDDDDDDDDESPLTAPELRAARAYDNMADILIDTHDKARQDAPDFTASLTKSHDALHAHLQAMMASLTQQQQQHGGAPNTPAFWPTLHALYTAWELSQTATQLLTALGNRAAGSGGGHEAQAEANKELEAAVRTLRTAVDEAWTRAKTAMDEPGWIDRVIESVAPAATAPATTTSTGAAAEGVHTLSTPLRAVVHEDFLEGWAGDLVESWRESVGGLAHLKMMTTSVMR